MQVASIPRGIGSRQELLYSEEQPFRSPHLLISLTFVSIACLAVVIWQAAGNPPLKPSHSKNAALAGTALLWLLLVRLANVSLVTRIHRGELSVAVPGFWRSCRISISSIRSAHPVTLDPEREYGGYGIRATRCARAFTAIGDRGVRLELFDGSAIIIGSRHPQQLAEAICGQIEYHSLTAP